MRQPLIIRRKLLGMVVVFGLCGALLTAISGPALADTVIGTCTIVSNPRPTKFTNCPGANLSGTNLLSTIDLSYANLSGANLTGANLGSSNLTNANLSGANLSDAPGEIHTQLGYANLTGANLSGANLTGASLSSTILTNANLTNAVLSGNDVSSANLTGATLTGVSSGGLFGTPAALPAPWIIVLGYLIGPGANLTGANLTGANLTGATLTGANLTNAVLSRANLSGTDLTGATLTGVISGGLTGSPAALPAGWSIVAGYLIGPGANLSTGPGLLTGANLTGATLSGANLTGANLTSAVLTGANLSGTNLTGATLTGVTSGGLIGTPAALPAGWTIVVGYLIGPGANLTGANLTGANLAGADLTGATLTGVTSGGITGTPAALPAGWILVDGYLIGPGANLSGANLTGANLTNATLANGNLTNATLTGANLTGADLTGATLTGVISGGLTGTPTALPAGWSIVAGYLMGPGANLTGVNLTNANLSGANLTSVTLTNANLTGANLTGANLTLADLTNANLTNATLTGANLTNTFLTPPGAILAGVISGAITGSPANLPPGWSVVAGYLIGPGANLTNATLTNANLSYATLTNAILTNANLTNAVLTGANLSGTNLTGATLTGVTSGGLIGTPAALPAGWTIVVGYLIGPGANLTGANLTGANLSNATLANANLTNATLTGANLSGADLTGATLTGVISGGITGTPAALPAGWTLVGGYLLPPSIHLLTITADNKTIVYGQPLPAFTYSVSGLLNGDPPSVVTGVVCTSTATPTSAAGTYPITCSGGTATNYVLSYAPGTLTIAKAPVTITADNKTIVYGQALPAFTYSVTGLLNGDPSSVVTGVVCTTRATSTSPGGAYPITCSGGTATNYAPTYQSGTLVISYNVSISAPLPNTVFRPGSIIPVKFQLTASNGQPLPNALAASLGCTVTVTFSTTGPVCATYNGKKGQLFQAMIPTPTTLTKGAGYPITVQVMAGTFVVAAATVNVIAK
jgi:uncharacterized protein YjbI with pentapeptide repeats